MKPKRCAVARPGSWRSAAVAGAAGRASRRLGLGGVLLCALASAGPATAQPVLPGFEPEPTAVVAQRRSITLEQAVERARGRYEGRVARADTVILDGRRVHQIRIVSDQGRTHTVRIDAATGEFLRDPDDDR